MWSCLAKEEKLGIYCMAKNFCGTKFRGLAAGKDFMKTFLSSTIAKPHPYWVYANHTHITHESAVMASEFSI